MNSRTNRILAHIVHEKNKLKKNQLLNRQSEPNDMTLRTSLYTLQRNKDSIYIIFRS